MSKAYKIAITDDTKLLRCRLLIKLIEIAGCKPILIKQNLINHNKKNNYLADDFISNRNSAITEHLIKVKRILKSCDAIIIPGNRSDIHPFEYDEKEIHHETEKRLQKKYTNVRFETEMYMAKYALTKRQVPILGICGGMQIINVALGGSLIQHIPDLKSPIKHQDPKLKKLTKLRQLTFEKKFKNHIRTGIPKNIFTPSHTMEVYEGSKLAEIYRAYDKNISLKDIYELSIHHQGCKKENLGEGLISSAVAKDGIVEAAELENHIMCLLLQFHVECNVSHIALQTIKSLRKALK